jgi:hypothetical protein
MSSRFKWFFLGVLLVMTIGATLLLKYPKLQSHMNADSYSITNLGGLSGTVTSNYVGKVNRVPTTLSAASQATNFILDCGLTNTYGNVNYASINADTNVHFVAISNSVFGSLLSVNVVATNANRTMSWPTNLFPRLNTNGLTLSGTNWYFTLTNGNELRLSFHTNITYSILWTTVGQ